VRARCDDLMVFPMITLIRTNCTGVFALSAIVLIMHPFGILRQSRSQAEGQSKCKR
jgi:hypothetical protein